MAPASPVRVQFTRNPSKPETDPNDIELSIRFAPLTLSLRGTRTHPCDNIVMLQGRDICSVADEADSLRMNLRQAKQALATRDEETRKLRAAVIHLESALAQRERELRDTVRLQNILLPGLFMGHDPTRRCGQKPFQISRVESGRVGSGRVGSG